MYVLAVIQPNLVGEQGLIILDSFLISFGEEDIRLALLQIAENPKRSNGNLVLVENIAISLNFRDKGIVIVANDVLKKNSSLKYFPIGSEFSGKVVIDDTVNIINKTLSNGCLVIPDCNFQADLLGFYTGVATNSAAVSQLLIPSNKLICVPETFDQTLVAGFALNMQTAYSMIRKVNLKGDETVLILGGSSSAALFILNSLLLKMSDMKITVITTDKEKLEKFKAIGQVDVVVIDKRATLNGKYLRSMLTTNNLIDKYDVVFDTFSDLYLSTFVHSLKMYGKYITCGFFNQGNPASFSSIAPQSFKGLLAAIIKKNISIIGNCLGETADLENALKDYTNNSSYLQLIDKVFNLSDYKEFVNRAFFDKSKFGKVILKMNYRNEN